MIDKKPSAREPSLESGKKEKNPISEQEKARGPSEILKTLVRLGKIFHIGTPQRLCNIAAL